LRLVKAPVLPYPNIIGSKRDALEEDIGGRHMHERKRKLALSVFCAWFIVCSSNTWADAVAVPCAKGTSGFLRDCVTKVIPDIIKDLEAYVRLQSKFYYDGKKLDPLSPDKNNPTTELFGKPVCNPIAGELNNNQEEWTQTHVDGSSCGEFTEIEVSFNWLLESSIYLRFAGNRGLREGAYIRGAWIQALTCYWKQVEKEITNNRSLSISKSCSSLAHDVKSLSKGSEDVSNQLRTILGNSDNIADIFACTADDPAKVETSKVQDYSVQEGAGIDVGPLRQSAHHLCAARSGIEAAFKQLAICEVFARAGYDYRVNGFENMGVVLKDIETQVTNVCTNQINQQCKNCWKWTKNPPKKCANCVNPKVNGCYQDKVKNAFKQKLQRWPNNGACPQTGGAA
jgi:hypothetical protein